MAKDKKQQNKKRKLQAAPVQSAPTIVHDLGGDVDGSIIELEELDIAVHVLQTLAEFPEELADKRTKELKRAAYDLHRVMSDGATLGASLTSKVSTALQDYRFQDALIFLFEMYIRKITPKLGALQRWVRECDATSGADGSPGDPEALKCLDLILRIANMSPGPMGSGVKTESEKGNVIKREKAWVARGPIDGEIKIWEMMKSGTLFDTPPSNPYPNFRPVHHVSAALRRPPNLYDSTVHASSPSAITLSPAHPSVSRPRTPSRLDVPGVPGAFMVLDVFTPDECLQIVRAAEAIGFEKDEAAAGSAMLKTSILARNFIWLADAPFLEHFYSQILPFVPPTAPVNPDGSGGGKVKGINARFRVYQYNENQLYRPHIDGAWPAAGLDPETGEYLHDSSPPDSPLWSRYTLLVYLNSDIPDDSGLTTFFLPSPDAMGTMEAKSVKPVQGAVLCFPHGDTQGSLLHEGSAVGPGMGKLVIRTELLFEAQGIGAFKPTVGSAGTAVVTAASKD